MTVDQLSFGEDLIPIGFGHGSLLNNLRPDIAYPDRKALHRHRKGAKVVTTITAERCECGDEHGHVEVFVRRVR